MSERKPPDEITVHEPGLIAIGDEESIARLKEALHGPAWVWDSSGDLWYRNPDTGKWERK